MVFAISGAFFCSPTSPEQCLNTQKVVCSFVVLCGVVLYAKSTAGLSKHMGSDDKQQSNLGDSDDDDGSDNAHIDIEREPLTTKRRNQ